MYSHTQRSPIYLVLFAVSFAMLAVAWAIRGEVFLTSLILVFAAMMLGLALSFKTLTISDEGNFLVVRFGPLRLFGTRIDYREITDVEAGRTTLLDGWGIHYVPQRGWTLNLWGRDCVKISRGNSQIQIGTDDVENLMKFLNKRTKSGPS